MKSFIKVSLTLCSLVLMMSLGSCKKFLEEMSPGLAIPKTVAQYEELLYGEGYPVKALDNLDYLDVMTDHVGFTHSTSSNNNWNINNINRRSLYTWAQDPESIEDGIMLGMWSQLYAKVMICNIVANDLQGLVLPIYETTAQRDHVRGQALLLRAHHYLTLANIYGEPYRAGQDSPMGIPLKLEAGASNKSFKRNTVHEVYKQILNDVEEGLRLIDKTIVKKSEMNYQAGLVLLTRVALQMENWNLVTEAGKKYLDLNPALNGSGTTFPQNAFMSLNNPEVTFLYGSGMASIGYMPSVHSGFRVSNTLMNLYQKDLAADEKDVRKDWFFAKTDISPDLYPKKLASGALNKNAYRTAEIYLNLAEAYVHTSDISKSHQMINFLRNSRILNYRPKSGLDNTALLSLIADERSRELCFEDIIRWMDLRRYNQSVTHQWEDATGKYQTVLEKGDKAFTLQIPKIEQERNPGIGLIQRPNRIVTKL